MDRDDAGAGRDPAADDSNATAPQQAGGTSPATSPQPNDTADPVSRRRFLRAAVIGGAGVAGGAAAVGALVASGNLPGAIPVQHALAQGPSFHDGNCSMCVSSSSGSSSSCGGVLVGENPGSGSGFTVKADNAGTCSAQNPGDFYIFFTAPNLPAGDYTMTFSADSNFALAPGKPYNRYVYPAGNASECPSCIDPSGVIAGATQANDSSLPGSLFPYTVPGTDGDPTPVQDLQLGVHMKYAPPTGTCPLGPFTFTATLTKSGQATAVCTGSVSVSATLKS